MNSIPLVSDLQSGRLAVLTGDPRAAVAPLTRAIAHAPADPEPLYWLASARLATGHSKAEAALGDARALHALLLAREVGVDVNRCQADPAYANEVANQLYGHGLVATSSVIREMALQKGRTAVENLGNYALALQHQGRIEEALRAFRAVGDAQPTAFTRQFMIFPQMFTEDAEARHFAAAREWVETFAPRIDAAPHANPGRSGRKLRIGYVAPRFAGSQLYQFIAPVLENHDPETVEVVLYPTSAETETDWPSWLDVHPLEGLDDAEAAALIRRDGIDVLADCWGHTADSRILVFAHRPAPVQAAWINFVQSTGLEQIDYVLHADAEDPPPTDGLYTERIWRIGPVFNAFRPVKGRLDPAPTPALAAGQVTFGSFNHPAKLSDSTLDAWSAALCEASDARLLLKYRYFADPVLQRVTQARFAARGVEPERIVFAGHSTGEDYFRSFREVDLMLDAWPAPGSTTTLEALSHGVPVLTKASATVGGQYVRSILESSGLHDLVCDSPEAFVARAVELASDVAGLDALRRRVRPGFDRGGCCDEAGFTRRVEAAFGEMFDLWRAGPRDGN
jgi:predicted O-linked N-acetylglucosamine transferase (SPINDLY family)